MLFDDRGAPAQRLVREVALGLLESAVTASSLAVATASGTAAYRRVSARHGHHVRLAGGLAAAFTGGVLTEGLLDTVTAGARRRLNGRDHNDLQAHRADADGWCHTAMTENSGPAPQKSGEKNATAGDHASSVGEEQTPLAAAAAPRETDDGGAASEGEGTAGVPDESPSSPGDEEKSVAASPSSADYHEVALQGLLSNADAVRYAIKALNSTHTPQIVNWLKERGRPVNRGQAHKITKAEAAKCRKSRTRMATTGTPPR